MYYTMCRYEWMEYICKDCLRFIRNEESVSVQEQFKLDLSSNASINDLDSEVGDRHALQLSKKE
jgi:hypothetical protein